ncbi:MAG: glycogen/starch synthase [Saprospiraceae bacterium]|nr:glycogen/starch synthase [Saprospiraceae bacterium]
MLHISYECYPFAKVGGMADVVGALPKYQTALDARASVVMPHFNRDWDQYGTLESVFEGGFHLDWEYIRFVVLRHPEVEGFELYSVGIPGKFDRPEIYSYRDDVQRSVAFQRAVLTWLSAMDAATRPQVLHCHDHHTGLIPFMAAHAYEFAELNRIATCFTIHNAAYQGAFSWDLLRLLPAFHGDRSGLLDWNDAINPLASAIKCAWHFNTVSRGYLDELFHSGHGLEGLIRSEAGKASGILNGIDTAVWDPASDPLLEVHLKRSIDVFKRKSKAEVCAGTDLDPKLPIYLFIGRLAYEKGADMLASILGDFMSHYDDVQCIVLGSGDPQIENKLRHLEQFFHRRARTFIMYNETLAHRLYAGCDFLLMPSRVEPCGLNQMYCMRYGGIPIVRRIGGLRDTVEPLSESGGNGYVFDHLEINEVRNVLSASRRLYQDGKQMSKVRQRNISIDFSWEHSAKQYLDTYASLLA